MKLPEYWLKRLVSARLSSVEQFSSIKDMERYGEDTQATLNYLLLHLLGVKEMGADMAARHIGQASTIVNFIRAMPNYCRKSVMPAVPKDLLTKYSIKEVF